MLSRIDILFLNDQGRVIAKVGCAVCGKRVGYGRLVVSPSGRKGKINKLLEFPFNLLLPSFFFFFFLILGPYPWYMEVPRLGSNQSCSFWPTTQPQQCQIWAASVTYTTSSWQHWILNPLSKAGDQTCILMDTSQIRFH